MAQAEIIVILTLFQPDNNVSVSGTEAYPPLWPVMVALQYFLAGAAIPEIGRWMSGLLYFAFLHAFWNSMKALGHGKWHSIIACAIFHLWFSHVSLAWGYAESLLLALSLASILSLFLYIKTSNKKCRTIRKGYARRGCGSGSGQ